MSGYVPFAYAQNNHGGGNLPHWQDPPRDASISKKWIDDSGGAVYVPRNLPPNFAWSNGKPAQAAPPNYFGIVATRPPLAHDNSYVSGAWRWRGPTIYSDEIVPAHLLK